MITEKMLELLCFKAVIEDYPKEFLTHLEKLTLNDEYEKLLEEFKNYKLQSVKNS